MRVCGSGMGGGGVWKEKSVSGIWGGVVAGLGRGAGGHKLGLGLLAEGV